MTGGGSDLKKSAKSKSCLFKILNLVKIYIKKHKVFNRTTDGSILIEFAVCMPVLIILLFYINDLSKLKRYYDQIEFVAQQMVNILQNISQNRAKSDRKITLPDIRYATSLAYLSFFPGKTEFVSRNHIKKSDLGYRPFGFIACVEGNADSTASVLWMRRFNMARETQISPATVAIDLNAAYNKRTNIKNLSNAVPSEIYPTLTIKPGEIKIIIECTIFYRQGEGYGFTDGRQTANVSPSQAFGLKLFKLSPRVCRDGCENDSLYFHSAAIFTPRPGLFDATPPAEHN